MSQMTTTPTKKAKKKKGRKGTKLESGFIHYMHPNEELSDTAKTRRVKAGPNFFLHWFNYSYKIRNF